MASCLLCLIVVAIYFLEVNPKLGRTSVQQPGNSPGFSQDFLSDLVKASRPCGAMVAAIALPMDCLKGCAQFLQPSVADVLDEDRRLQLWDGVDLTQLSETSLRRHLT